MSAKKWTEEETLILTDNKSLSNKELQKLLPGRSNLSIKKKKRKLSLTVDRAWKEEEIDILIKNQSLPLKELRKLLPGRTKGAISCKEKKLGLIFERQTNKWTIEETKILIQNKSLSLNELEHFLPQRNKNAILSRKNLLGLIEKKPPIEKITIDNSVKRKARKPVYKLNQNFTLDELDNETYQVLIGSILGDGGITKNGNVNVFKETHGVEQKDYAEWKRKMLAVFQPCKLSCVDIKPIFSTPYHHIFDSIRQNWYNEKEERKAFIHMDHVKNLDLFGLFIWHMDDANQESNCIYSSCFTKNNLQEVVNMINNKFDLSLYLTGSKIVNDKLVNNIYFDKRNRNKISEIWKNYFIKYELPNCMAYKLY